MRILVVDDDMLARMTAAQCIKKMGHDTTLSDGGDKALEMLRSGDYDLVLLDILMPGKNGFDVLTEIKADLKLREIPVVMVSGTEELESMSKCLQAGAAGFLSKPLDSGPLAELIDRFVR